MPSYSDLWCTVNHNTRFKLPLVKDHWQRQCVFPTLIFNVYRSGRNLARENEHGVDRILKLNIRRWRHLAIYRVIVESACTTTNIHLSNTVKTVARFRYGLMAIPQEQILSSRSCRQKIDVFSLLPVGSQTKKRHSAPWQCSCRSVIWEIKTSTRTPWIIKYVCWKQRREIPRDVKQVTATEVTTTRER